MQPKQLEWATHQERLGRLKAELGQGNSPSNGAT
jgi:hypothetical protein